MAGSPSSNRQGRQGCGTNERQSIGQPGTMPLTRWPGSEGTRGMSEIATYQPAVPLCAVSFGVCQAQKAQEGTRGLFFPFLEAALDREAEGVGFLWGMGKQVGTVPRERPDAAAAATIDAIVCSKRGVAGGQDEAIHRGPSHWMACLVRHGFGWWFAGGGWNGGDDGKCG